MSPEPARVLVIEDDAVLRACLRDGFVDAGYRVAAFSDGREFERALAEHRPDVVVLDVMLPGRSGLVLAAELRTRIDAAVLFLTARDAVPDRLAGFAAGADDYLVKPFAMAELLARLRAVLRRTGRAPDVLRVGDLVVDEEGGQVLRSGAQVGVTATELRLLGYLARNRNRVLSKTQILTQVWGYDAYDPNLVEAYVSSLRRKLDAAGPRLIHTVRGVGYRLGGPA
jgi:DNA-binding response OmpR family regulator